LHPTLDVALLALEDEPLGNIAPVPLLGALDDTWIGSPVELAGYGTDTVGADGVLQFATEEILRLETDHVVVAAVGRSGACEGDSGGPVLTRGDDGLIGVAGILDRGARTCVGEDFYTRSDLLVAWPAFAESDVSKPISGCIGLDEQGICLRRMAMWCASGQVQTQTCSEPGRACGWSPTSTGFRCVEEASDPCMGMGSVHRCIGDSVVWCSGGVVAQEDCQRCGMKCTPWASSDGATCQ
jgi:hypothetical protein